MRNINERPRVYISLPMAGRDEKEIMEEIRLMRQAAEERGWEPVDPVEVNRGLPGGYPEKLGRDIAALLRCDAIMMGSQWERSAGCRLEMRAATIYKIEIYGSCREFKNFQRMIQEAW